MATEGEREREKERRRKEAQRAIKKGIKKLTKLPKSKKRRTTKLRKRKGIAKIKKPQSITQWKKGRLLGKGADVEAVGMVVSPRGRDIERPTPGMKPSAGMPQSTQDFFLTSRAIRTMAYDYKKHILQLQYQSGQVYNYYEVPELVWIALKNASSKGRYVYYNIRTSYKYMRVK